MNPKPAVLLSVGHNVGPWALYSPVQIRKPVSKKIEVPTRAQMKILSFEPPLPCRFKTNCNVLKMRTFLVFRSNFSRNPQSFSTQILSWISTHAFRLPSAKFSSVSMRETNRLAIFLPEYVLVEGFWRATNCLNFLMIKNFISDEQNS